MSSSEKDPMARAVQGLAELGETAAVDRPGGASGGRIEALVRVRGQVEALLLDEVAAFDLHL
jgi:hypothetical protein